MRRSVREAEAQELTLPRSSNGTLRLIDLEFEAMSDERRKTRHHTLSRSFAADVDIAIIRISHEAVSASLQLLVPFVEHQITQQWRQYSLDAKANFDFERRITRWRHKAVVDLRRKEYYSYVTWRDPRRRKRRKG